MLDKEALEQLCNAVDAALASRGLAGARVTGGTVTPYEIRLSVSVPRSDILPVRLAPLLQGLRNVPPVTAVLGLADDGVPLLIRLSSPDVRHILVTGPAGCGKSALLRTIAISILLFTPGLKVAVSAAPPDLARLIQVRQRRRETWPPVVALYDGPMSLDGLEAILRDGWQLGVHVILATRHLTVLRRLVDLFPVQIVGTQPGDFTAHTPEGRFRFWAAWPDVDASTLFRQYGGDKEDAPVQEVPDGRVLTAF